MTTSSNSLTICLNYNTVQPCNGVCNPRLLLAEQERIQNQVGLHVFFANRFNSTFCQSMVKGRGLPLEFEGTDKSSHAKESVSYSQSISVIECPRGQKVSLSIISFEAFKIAPKCERFSQVQRQAKAARNRGRSADDLISLTCNNDWENENYGFGTRFKTICCRVMIEKVLK